MKRTVLFIVTILSMTLYNCKAGNPEKNVNVSTTNVLVRQLTNDSFKKMVYNYDVNKVWKYEGSRPAIIDFYAHWCAPCRQLSPLVEEIAKEYEGKIDVYKVDTDKEKVLTQSLGISSLPTLLFIPANGKPQITIGVLPKETLVQTINELLIKK